VTSRFTYRRPTGLLLVAPTAAFVLLALVVSVGSGPVPRFDAWVSGIAHAAGLSHPMWRAAMNAVTVTGSTSVLGPLVILGCLALLLRGHWRPAVFAGAAMIFTVVARLVVVAVIARPRPVDPLAPASNYSFPSGHSTASAAAALILVLVCWPMLRQRSIRMALAIVAGLWAFTVGLSRVALVVHWPTDVLGAWLFVLVTVPGVGLLLRHLPGSRGH
jgi:undecaprenyl-diphosphatase